MNLEPNVSEEQRQQESQNPYTVNEDDLRNGVVASDVTCRPVEDSDRFYDCSPGTSNDMAGRKNMVVKVDAVNDKTKETDTQVRATRVAATEVQSLNKREDLKVTGTCRNSNHTNRGTFCELTVEDN